MRALGHGGIPRYGVLRRDRGDAVLVAERDGEQERGFTQGVCVFGCAMVITRCYYCRRLVTFVHSVRRSVRPSDAFVVDWITLLRRDAPESNDGPVP